MLARAGRHFHDMAGACVARRCTRVRTAQDTPQTNVTTIALDRPPPGRRPNLEPEPQNRTYALHNHDRTAVIQTKFTLRIRLQSAQDGAERCRTHALSRKGARTMQPEHSQQIDQNLITPGRGCHVHQSARRGSDRYRHASRGQILILIAGALVAIVGMLGLATDLGYNFAQRRTMQNAADAGALAGAHTLSKRVTGRAERSAGRPVSRCRQQAWRFDPVHHELYLCG